MKRIKVRQAQPSYAYHLATWAKSKAHLFPDELRPPINSLHTAVTLQHAIESGCVCFYHQHGFLVGNAQVCPINHDHKIAQTLTFVSEEYGLELLRAFEKWAREQGCSHVTVSVLASLADKRRFRVWERLGYTCGDHSLVKAL